MGLATRICAALSFDAHRLTRLAQIGAASEQLAARLQQHAALCDAPNIKAGLASLAIAEANDAADLRELLALRQAVPQQASPSQHNGSSNWARISEDLAAELEMVRAINGAIAEWEGADREIAAILRTIAGAKEITLGRLRDLALRCDPQALD